MPEVFGFFEGLKFDNFDKGSCIFCDSHKENTKRKITDLKQAISKYNKVGI